MKLLGQDDLSVPSKNVQILTASFYRVLYCLKLNLLKDTRKKCCARNCLCLVMSKMA